ncbi:M1 family peptidase [Chitinophaga silvatica]|uniref:M1 family peptidase n=1 Tax=Chitinophaga silvatica TaxID=2282649 RepID=A0A3E1Y8W0_9BACT|nr:M1 family metallopeptidase [Chitinophaga silvatica]RFS21834.1 M1 family peptidase [Chitinophaga silvatica]
MKKPCLLAFLCLTGIISSAQELYMPRNIRKAYEKNTRSLTGAPGKNYWQNKGIYQLNINVNPPTRKVTGLTTIDYVNNSPDTLRKLVLRMIVNIHKPQATRSGYVAKDYLTNGMTIDSLVIDGQTIPFDNDIGTVANIKLKQPLLHGNHVKLAIKYHYDLSLLSGREGMLDATTAFLAYAYPRISVYDDYNGWDVLEHSDRAEFYSDFNDYDVNITAPKDYVVWGTGNLLNLTEVLQPEIATRLKNSYTSDKVIHIADRSEMAQGKVTRQQEWNTWHFSADNIADVTYAVSKNYVWDAASTVVDSSTMRRASVQAAYNDTATDFHHSVTFGQHALNWFSHNWPGVPYPFPVMTAVQGFADMEYPMMVNDESVGDDLPFAQFVQDHEIAHTWFPFYMGTNETRYAFMDEGWATTFEYLIAIAEKGKEAADAAYREFRVAGYINNPATEEDQPINSMSTQVSGAGYSHNSYGKASLAYLALKDLLGDRDFRKCLHAYMNNWHGKHPMPWDFFYSFNTAYGQSLNWFWNNWFFSNNYIDLRIVSAKQQKNELNLAIKNVGGFAIPFDVVITYRDGSSTSVHHTPVIWKDKAAVNLKLPVNKPVKEVRLHGNLFMDATEQDNTITL